MTWHFTASGESITVYDHTGAIVATDREFGGVWTGDYPDVVLEVMDAEAKAAYAEGDTERAIQCLRHGAFELIEHDEPP